jgi:hypothetical protein
MYVRATINKEAAQSVQPGGVGLFAGGAEWRRLLEQGVQRPRRLAESRRTSAFQPLVGLPCAAYDRSDVASQMGRHRPWIFRLRSAH